MFMVYVVHVRLGEDLLQSLSRVMMMAHKLCFYTKVANLF